MTPTVPSIFRCLCCQRRGEKTEKSYFCGIIRQIECPKKNPEGLSTSIRNRVNQLIRCLGILNFLNIFSPNFYSWCHRLTLTFSRKASGCMEMCNCWSVDRKRISFQPPLPPASPQLFNGALLFGLLHCHRSRLFPLPCLTIYVFTTINKNSLFYPRPAAPLLSSFGEMRSIIVDGTAKFRK